MRQATTTAERLSLPGLIEVSVDYRGDNVDALQKEMKEAGAKAVKVG